MFRIILSFIRMVIKIIKILVAIFFIYLIYEIYIFNKSYTNKAIVNLIIVPKKIESKPIEPDKILKEHIFHNITFKNGILMNFKALKCDSIEVLEKLSNIDFNHRMLDSNILDSILSCEVIDKELSYIIYDKKSKCNNQHPIQDISEIDYENIREVQESAELFTNNIKIWKNIYVIFGEDKYFEDDVIGLNYSNLTNNNYTIVYVNNDAISQADHHHNNTFTHVVLHELGHSMCRYDDMNNINKINFYDEDEESFCDDFAYNLSNNRLISEVQEFLKMV